MRGLLRALFGMVLNRPLVLLNDDGSVFAYDQVDRADRWAITRPGWTYTLLARRLPCGCTRRIRLVTISGGCERHMGDLWPSLRPGREDTA